MSLSKMRGNYLLRKVKQIALVYNAEWEGMEHANQ